MDYTQIIIAISSLSLITNLISYKSIRFVFARILFSIYIKFLNTNQGVFEHCIRWHGIFVHGAYLSSDPRRQFGDFRGVRFPVDFDWSVDKFEQCVKSGQFSGYSCWEMCKIRYVSQKFDRLRSDHDYISPPAFIKLLEEFEDGKQIANKSYKRLKKIYKQKTKHQKNNFSTSKMLLEKSNCCIGDPRLFINGVEFGVYRNDGSRWGYISIPDEHLFDDNAFNKHCRDFINEYDIYLSHKNLLTKKGQL